MTFKKVRKVFAQLGLAIYGLMVLACFVQMVLWLAESAWIVLFILGGAALISFCFFCMWTEYLD